MASHARVDVSDLDWEGEHLFWAAPASRELFASIRELGQLEPILARPTPGGWKLLSGAQRVEALSRLRMPVLVQAWTRPGAGPADDGLIYLHANVHKVLDDSMRIKALRHFQPLLQPGELAARVAPLLRLQPRSGAWRQHMAWLELPRQWDAHLHHGNIPLAAAPILTRLAKPDLDALEPFFSGWKWSRNNAVQWLTSLHESALREGWSMEQALAHAEAGTVLEAAELSPQDAMQRLCTRAKALRFPHVSRLEGEFARQWSQLLGTSRWQVDPEQNFESNAVHLRLRAKTPGEFQEAARALTRAAEAERLGRLFRIAEDD